MSCEVEGSWMEGNRVAYKALFSQFVNFVVAHNVKMCFDFLYCDFLCSVLDVQ